MTSGIEKASALLLGLGVDRSSRVLQYLNEGEIEQVLMVLGKPGSVAPEVRHEALQEACELSMSDTSEMRGGIEYSRQLLARAVGPRRGTEILERISVHQQLSSFDMLKNANTTEVATLLQEEMPQTIALVLSYLEAKVAADILTSMPKEIQIEVTLRLAAMDRVSPQVVQQVEKSLKSKLSSVINEADSRNHRDTRITAIGGCDLPTGAGKYDGKGAGPPDHAGEHLSRIIVYCRHRSRFSLFRRSVLRGSFRGPARPPASWKRETAPASIR